jgi:hypothetical protein
MRQVATRQRERLGRERRQWLQDHDRRAQEHEAAGGQWFVDDTARDLVVGVLARGAAADERDRIADDRDRLADDREATADHRDRVADERDRVADEREAIADDRDRLADDRDTPVKRLTEADSQQ